MADRRCVLSYRGAGRAGSSIAAGELVFLFLVVKQALSVDLDHYFELESPDTADEALLLEAITGKAAAYAESEAELARIASAGGPEAADAIAQVGSVYEEMAHFLGHGPPPLSLTPGQAGIYRAVVMEKALAQCDKARLAYARALELQPKNTLARKGRARLSLDAVKMPAPERLERDVDRWLASWPRAEKPEVAVRDPPLQQEPRGLIGVYVESSDWEDRGSIAVYGGSFAEPPPAACEGAASETRR